MKRVLAWAFTLPLIACAASPPPAPGTPKVVEGVAQAALSPLVDLNLVHTAIPPVLLAARKGAYRAPPQGCEALRAEIAELEAVLDGDVNAPKSRAEPNLLERGAQAAENAAVGMVRGTAEAVVPFRGWVRRLTGAERQSKEVTSAISAGNLRRAYLKGVAHGAGCEVSL